MPQQRTIPRVCRVCEKPFLARGADVAAGKALVCSAELVIALSHLGYTTGGSAGRHVSDETRVAREPLMEEMRLLNHRGLLLTES